MSYTATFRVALQSSRVENHLDESHRGVNLVVSAFRYLPEVMWPASKRLSNQGGFFMALDPAAFLPREEFVAQMERFVDEAGTMEPFPGQAHADLPGGYEARMTAEYLRAVSAPATSC